MRPKPRYPVDRYLGESSKKIEMVNIKHDDLWNSEPVIRPEDEIILHKLQDMLESTAEDLKILSQEMSKFHEPGVRVKRLPTPLDEEFNEKVHIEELVDAKFHGYKIVDPPTVQDTETIEKEKDMKTELLNEFVKTAATVLSQKAEKKVSTKTQTNRVPPVKPPVRNLKISKTKIMNIIDESKYKVLTNQSKQTKPKIGEFSYSYAEPKKKPSPCRGLEIQHMPAINIRSELKEQKVLQLDILPEKVENAGSSYNKKNICVVSISHDAIPINISAANKPSQTKVISSSLPHSKTSVRRITKMSPGESTSSTSLNYGPLKCTEKKKKSSPQIRIPPKSEVIRRRLSPNNRKSQKPRTDDLERWNKKLNVVYGPAYYGKRTTATTTSKKSGVSSVTKPCDTVRRPNVTITDRPKINLKKQLNNSQYIPYSQLTVGGARASDIEKEINEISDRGNLPLSPIIDRIISSRENSYSENTKHKDTSKVLTTSDENLLQEVIDIEKKVSQTLSKNFVRKRREPKEAVKDLTNDQASDVSYDDDFEVEKSEMDNDNMKKGSLDSSEGETDRNLHDTARHSIQNETYVKASNLSFKESVDVFEYIHAVDTQESATQSQTLHKLSLKETQTSPTHERPSIHPIHNDLWSSVDPKGEVEKLFQLEKDFIKKLILEEYGDLLEKNIAKPSTSNDSTACNFPEKNVTAAQKVTQTSPARAKSAMTSPKICKTRTTSPLALTFKVDRHTSPLDFDSPDQDLQIQIESSREDLGISINLSSPRFSLRLPQSSRDVISNLEPPDSLSRKDTKSIKTHRSTKSKVISSSSTEVISTSEMSSLGEIFRPRKTSRRTRAPTVSHSSSSSIYHDTSDLFSSELVHLKSDGELSIQLGGGDLPSKSDGEMDFIHRHRRKK